MFLEQHGANAAVDTSAHVPGPTCRIMRRYNFVGPSFVSKKAKPLSSRSIARVVGDIVQENDEGKFEIGVLPVDFSGFQARATFLPTVDRNGRAAFLESVL